MARYTGPKGKIVRRFGANIYGNPKFDRLLAKKPNPPGVHGATAARRKVSEYGVQLIEKQKIKFCYGVLEKQFRVTFNRAARKTGMTGNNLLILLETRLDNVVYRAGWGGTRDQARQLVNHGHVKINGRRTDIPSYTVREGDEITVKESSKSSVLIQRMMEENSSRPSTEWLTVNTDGSSIKVDRLPLREEIQSPGNEQLVVELFSK
ncbi:MAG: 30S ribosomal protein S4 [Lentisphaeria bacterium]|nr:30S ribosomal protein S4 [Lentisphaeria bacterium]NQZ67526.1 30S ribosomal protein S4 [Lentisphaeria bacterium]